MLLQVAVATGDICVCRTVRNILSCSAEALTGKNLQTFLPQAELSLREWPLRAVNQVVLVVAATAVYVWDGCCDIDDALADLILLSRAVSHEPTDEELSKASGGFANLGLVWLSPHSIPLSIGPPRTNARQRSANSTVRFSFDETEMTEEASPFRKRTRALSISSDLDDAITSVYSSNSGMKRCKDSFSGLDEGERRMVRAAKSALSGYAASEEPAKTKSAPLPSFRRTESVSTLLCELTVDLPSKHRGRSTLASSLASADWGWFSG
jgi:hypothetical protein